MTAREKLLMSALKEAHMLLALAENEELENHPDREKMIESACESKQHAINFNYESFRTLQEKDDTRLTGHETPSLLPQLQLYVNTEKATEGNGSYEYLIVGENPEGGNLYIPLMFQNGNPQQVGLNGVTFEVCLEAMIHRLETFQKGPFACEENHEAREHMVNAQLALHRRSLRFMRGSAPRTQDDLDVSDFEINELPVDARGNTKELRYVDESPWHTPDDSNRLFNDEDLKDKE